MKKSIEKELTYIQAIQCNNCKDIVFSRANHDCRACSCFENKIDNKGCYIDGGFNPIYRVGGNPENITNLRLATKITKNELYLDWAKGKDKYGLFKKGKLTGNFTEVKD